MGGVNEAFLWLGVRDEGSVLERNRELFCE